MKLSIATVVILGTFLLAQGFAQRQTPPTTGVMTERRHSRGGGEGRRELRRSRVKGRPARSHRRVVACVE
jgi:hypothetical protein